MHTATEKQSGNTFGIVLVAAMAGAVAALLLAPKRGSEMREDIKGHYNTMKQKTQSTADKMSEGMETMKDKAKDMKETAKEAIDETKNITKDQMSSGIESDMTQDARSTSRRPRL